MSALKRRSLRGKGNYVFIVIRYMAGANCSNNPIQKSTGKVFIHISQSKMRLAGVGRASASTVVFRAGAPITIWLADITKRTELKSFILSVHQLLGAKPGCWGEWGA